MECTVQLLNLLALMNLSFALGGLVGLALRSLRTGRLNHAVASA